MIVLKLTGWTLAAGVALLFIVVVGVVMLEIKAEDTLGRMAMRRRLR